MSGKARGGDKLKREKMKKDNPRGKKKGGKKYKKTTKTFERSEMRRNFKI